MKTKKSAAGSLVELVVIVVTAIGLALAIQAFLVKPFRIPSESMEPTLVPTQRVLVDRIGARFGKPKLGDIIVFHPPKGAEDAGATSESRCGNPRQGQGFPQACDRPTNQKASTNFIKRVVGLPGDRIAIRNGRVLRNGVPEKDSYIRPCAPSDGDCNFPKPILIPPGHYFMMGDNRGQSLDSRFWGPIPRSWIIGGAFATYWPPKRIGLL